MSQIAVELAELASVIGEVSRAHMLTALMGGGALSALELSLAAGITPQTASSHLAKLHEAKLLVLRTEGRHRYYRLASAQVAQTLEALMALTVDGPPRHRARSRPDDELRRARTCYDHLAGQIGVAICTALLDQGHVVLEADGGEVTEAGHEFFIQLGIDFSLPAKSRRIFCRSCLDWSERVPHLAGRVGAEIAAFCIGQKWLARKTGTRALSITRQGSQRLPEVFGFALETF